MKKRITFVALDVHKKEHRVAMQVVIALALIPRKPGDRVKTDRRDSRELLKLFQAGLLMPIWVPNEEEEAVRDLCRCREAAKKDLNRMRHRLGDFLLRQGYHYNEGNKWTQRHMAWLGTLKFGNRKNQYVFNEYLSQVIDQQERVKQLDKMMQEMEQEQQYSSPVGYLKCFYGIDIVTALNLVSELYAVRNLTHTLICGNR